MKQPLIIIILLALALRLYQFGSLPHGVNRDEAAIGYTAYMLLKTGHDEHNRAWPLRFESFGDWKQPLYIYLTIPIIFLFGLSPLTVRALSLLTGIGLIVTTYLLTRTLLPKTKTSIGEVAALSAAALLTLNPWHFHFSRLALEALLAAAFLSIGIFLLTTHTKVSTRLWGLSLLFAAFLTYHAALIVIPIWLICYLILYRNSLRKDLFLAGIILFFCAVTALLAQSWFSPERAKVSGTTIFSPGNDNLWNQIYSHRDGSLFSKLRHNQYSYFATTIATNYLRTFSPTFLFFKGGNHPNYNVPGFGNFFPLEIVLAAAGVVYCLKAKTKPSLLILALLLLSPLPAAITTDGVHSTREIFLLPSLEILAGLGTYFLLSRRNKSQITLATCGILLIAVFEALPFYRYYFGPYQTVSDRIFSGYMEPISHYLQSEHDRHRTIYLTYPFESPYIFYAFYTRLDPKAFLTSIEYYPPDALGFRHAKRLENMEYVPSTKDVFATNPKEALILARVQELPTALPRLVTWYNQSGQAEIASVTCNNSLPGTGNTAPIACPK